MQLKRFFLYMFLASTGVLTSFNTVRDSTPVSEDFIVVLDAGHGGHDPGNLGNGYLEKNIALNIVLKVGEALNAHPGIKVIYTRKDDTFVDLYVRGEIANKANADLFVSVHCDSHTSDANGAGTFVLGLHANKQNFEIAKKENSAIYLEDNYETRYAEYDINSPESIIGLTIMQEEFLDQSIMLAKMMQDNFSNKLKRNDRKVKQAGFIVLHQTFMPSVLVETGFLTHKTEGGYLNSRKGQSEMGKAIANAVVEYKDNVRGGIPQPTPKLKEEPLITEVPKKDIPKPKNTADKKTTKQVIKEEVVAEKSNKPQDKAVPPPSVTNEVATVEKEIRTPQKIEKESISKDKPSEKIEESPDVAVAEVAKEASEKPKEVKTQKQVQEPLPKEKKEVVSAPANPGKKAGSAIIFKVQLLASSKDMPLVSGDFKGLNRLSKEPYKNLFRYLYGNVKLYKQAELLRQNAALKGYKTAFIVAYKDGDRISVPDAVKYLAQQ